MATTDFSGQSTITDATPKTSARAAALSHPVVVAVEALASLRFTVVLLALFTFLVFVGTLAQKEHDIWDVVQHDYFRVFVAKVEFSTLSALVSVFNERGIPESYSLFHGGHYFLFPGGYTIGILMAINLLAAHAWRFTMSRSARGSRLILGLVLLAAGGVATTLVVMRALQTGAEADISSSFAGQLWNILRGAFAGLALTGAYGLSLIWNRVRRPEWFILAGIDAVLLATAIWLFANPQWQINDAGMRIVWQLLQATIAGGILAVGCRLLFAQRSGIVLLHVGIAVLMGHELYTGVTAVENRMSIDEGATSSYTYSHRSAELAVIDKSNPEKDSVVSIPVDALRQAQASPPNSPGRIISDDRLPFDLRVKEFYENATAVPINDESTTMVTGGAGLEFDFEEREPSTGPDVFNWPTAYLEILNKDSQKPLGTYVVSRWFDRNNPISTSAKRALVPFEQQKVEVDGKPFALAIWSERFEKPYSITLNNFEFDRYVGTNKAKSYSSDVLLVDHENDVTIEKTISMNNPLRYRGETFYQADFDQETENTTILQVVKNESWMLPYLGCMFVAIGMSVHFSIALIRFLNRRARESVATPSIDVPWFQRTDVLVPITAALFTASYLVYTAKPEAVIVDKMSIDDFGMLPVAQEGRVKPIDSVARNTLQYLCERQEAPADVKGKIKIPATQWLLDVISQKKGWDEYYVFRITNPDLLDSLDLPYRPKFLRYSYKEIDDCLDKLLRQTADTAQANKKFLSPQEKQAFDLLKKLRMHRVLVEAFTVPKWNPDDPIALFLFDQMESYARLIKDEQTPLAVAPDEVGSAWTSVYQSALASEVKLHQTEIKKSLMADLLIINQRLAQPISDPMLKQQLIEYSKMLRRVPAFVSEVEQLPPSSSHEDFQQILSAYRNGDEKKFQQSLESHRQALAHHGKATEQARERLIAEGTAEAELLDSERVAFEHWFNSASLFFYSMVMYVVAFLLSTKALVVWPRTLNRTATAILVVTLIAHTLALAARVYISGRPPITNIYTTLVCVGWLIVAVSLILESIFRLGFFNLIAAASGALTLTIAHNLAMDGDTFTVLQAVLDTQFWLFTHVLSINIGYGATLLAGIMGIVYLLLVHVLQVASKDLERRLSGILYGMLCFAIFFSFVGTVLGGLWGDDSWGRFWGWDPKENGAMMIVLWNAVALHARWGAMVSTRGLALITIVGNIITAWSWFGVNQLRVGLHSYGFSDMLGQGLLIFIITQLIVLMIGMVPKEAWGALFSRFRRAGQAG